MGQKKNTTFKKALVQNINLKGSINYVSSQKVSIRKNRKKKICSQKVKMIKPTLNARLPGKGNFTKPFLFIGQN